ncbi:MAG: MrtC family glutamic-type intramembrane protease [Sandaracinus sp.]
MRPLTEVLAVYAAVAVVTAALGALRDVAWAGDLVALGIAATFLAAAVAMARRDADRTRFGISLGGLLDPIEDDARPAGPLGLYDLGRTLRAGLPSALRETGFALAVAAVIFPPFVVGFWLWHGPSHAFAWRWPPDFASFVLSQIVLVGLPEEALFRGYVQTRLGDHFFTRWRILGTEVVVGAWILQAALFALVHLATGPDVQKLATFFPGLLFGWLRARRGGIGAGIVMHAASNVLAEVLVTGWLAP